MSTVRFRAGTIDLELSGTESFVNRQLHRLTRILGEVDEAALVTEAAPREIESGGNGAATPDLPMPMPEATPDAPREMDELRTLLDVLPANGPDRQVEAGLLFAYHLRTRQGKDTFGIGDLIRCCIRAGVDTRNFNRVLGTLTRRGFLEAVPPGNSYRLSEQGNAVVESRMELQG